MTYDTYLAELLDRFWRFRDSEFAGHDAAFRQPERRTSRPPVFIKSRADFNVLMPKGLTAAQRLAVLGSIPISARHTWFGSMRSSQALAQSVFGNLTVLQHLAVLKDVTTVEGERVFSDLNAQTHCELEHPVTYLRERPPRFTSVDVLFEHNVRICIECKLSEPDVGNCSRPKLKPAELAYCNGQYCHQGKRQKRCSLSEDHIAYWDYIPQLFDWSSEVDHSPCPIRTTYQIVRNVLAACIDPRGNVRKDGRAVLLVDKRNPAYLKDGAGRNAYEAAKVALRKPDTVQMCYWQDVVAAMRTCAELDDLTSMINSKYGL